MEDTAAFLNIIVVTIALLLIQISDNANFDAIDSLIIGLILMTFALFLAKENKALLIG